MSIRDVLQIIIGDCKMLIVSSETVSGNFCFTKSFGLVLRSETVSEKFVLSFERFVRKITMQIHYSAFYHPLLFGDTTSLGTC